MSLSKDAGWIHKFALDGFKSFKILAFTNCCYRCEANRELIKQHMATTLAAINHRLGKVKR